MPKSPKKGRLGMTIERIKKVLTEPIQPRGTSGNKNQQNQLDEQPGTSRRGLRIEVKRRGGRRS